VAGYLELQGIDPPEPPANKQVYKHTNGTPVGLFPSIFFIAFLAVSLHEEPKNATKIFSQIRPGDLKKTNLKKRSVGRCVSFVFLNAP
jgi:hypothetical protein